METKILKFRENNNVRYVENIEDQSWFVAKDVCEILGLSEVSKFMDRLDDDEKLIRKLFVSGQQRDTWTINEFGLYALILNSNKSEAKEFKRWITHEVIPSIRKAGKYTSEQEKAKDIELQLVIKDIETKKTELKRLRTDINNLKSKISKSEKRRDEIITNYNPQLPFPTQE